MYAVVLTLRAAKQLGKISAKDRTHILETMAGLRDDPWKGKKLQGELAGLFSLRVWPYRIIYTIEKKIVRVTVVTIGQRKDVYERMVRAGKAR